MFPSDFKGVVIGQNPNKKEQWLLHINMLGMNSTEVSNLVAQLELSKQQAVAVLARMLMPKGDGKA